VDVSFYENFGDGHEVLGQGTGFIGANVISTTHGFAGLKISDQVVLLFHFSDRVGEGNGD
jgi:hypothetical protein